MEKSALQIARAAYQPKLPKALRGALKAVEGEPTQSVADQEEVKKLDLGSITEEMMFMITSKMHDDTLKESSEEARDETADEDTVSKSVTEEE